MSLLFPKTIRIKHMNLYNVLQHAIVLLNQTDNKFPCVFHIIIEPVIYS
jgi:hypothetical protein